MNEWMNEWTNKWESLLSRNLCLLGRKHFICRMYKILHKVYARQLKSLMLRVIREKVFFCFFVFPLAASLPCPAPPSLSKFPGQGVNLHHGSHSSDNARSLTHYTTGDYREQGIFIGQIGQGKGKMLALGWVGFKKS